jgi:uncharacterized protein (DUF433 family)
MHTHLRKSSRIGVGLYSIRQTARLLGVPASKVHRWIRPETGLVPRYFDPQEHTLTFVELMELHFIKMFRAEGVSLSVIRRVSQVAAKKFGSHYPFTVKRFDTDGRTVFATLMSDASGTVQLEDLQSGQLVFQQIVKPFFRKLEYNGLELARFWPLEKRGRIVLDPERQFGKPIDAETGVPTKALFDAIKAGGGQDYKEVANWFGVPLSAVESAVTFEKSIAV